MDEAEVSTTVVVVTWRGAAHITACLDALAAQDRPHRTLVVDNASDDGTAGLLTGHEVLRLPRNAGYAGALAEALSVVDTPFMAWLNDDAMPAPDWLSALEDALVKTPEAAAMGSLMELPDGTPQSLGVRLTADGHGCDLTEDLTEPAHDVFGFCGGAVLLRTDQLREIGGVPADFFCYYEDTDTAWRLRLAGWDIRHVPGARVVHHHGASTKPGSPLFHRWNERNRLLMLLRCAPARVALRELVKFAILTAVLPFRGEPAAPNFRLFLRCRVLAEVFTRLPAALRARRCITARAVLGRGEVWDAWAAG